MTNNVNQDWNAVISSAQQQITSLEASRATTPAGAPTQEINSRIAQLRTDIANAQRQLTLQASQTNPTNTSTVSAVALPASASPGNATVATSTATTVPTATTAVDPTYTFPDNSDLLPPPPIFGPENPVGPDEFTIEANAFLNLNPEGSSQGSSVGLSGATNEAQASASAQDRANFEALANDWRVRLSLAPGADYLYKATNPGILAPLKATNGVVFPYTPLVNVSYSANYSPTDIVHSNYKMYQYSNSSVDNVSITCDFTAQDIEEANYMLAVIHFFKSMTKMFYGQDESPRNGTPPPLCYMFGLGSFQFEAHPLVIQSFNYNLPNDVDYIRVSTPTSASTSAVGVGALAGAAASAAAARLPANVQAGGVAPSVQFPSDGGGSAPTYVPTKITLIINCVPIMSRNAVSNNFSLQKYATGELMRGTKNPFRGMW